MTFFKKKPDEMSKLLMTKDDCFFGDAHKLKKRREEFLRSKIEQWRFDLKNKKPDSGFDPDWNTDKPPARSRSRSNEKKDLESPEKRIQPKPVPNPTVTIMSIYTDKAGHRGDVWMQQEETIWDLKLRIAKFVKGHIWNDGPEYFQIFLKDKGRFMQDNWRSLAEYGLLNGGLYKIRLAYDFEKKAKE